MSYKPIDERFILSDTWHCSTGDKVHAFFLQLQKNGKEDVGKESGTIGHAVSSDMLKWEQLPLAVPCGEPGSYDDLDHYTGCTVYCNDKFYLFYTSRSSVNELTGTSLAISTDGIHFEKHPDNPLFTPDQRYYYGVDNRPGLLVHGNPEPGKNYDMRDLCVCWDQEAQLWRGYFVARAIGDDCTKTAAIAMCTSQDLIHWEQFPPCFAPQKYHVIETPEVFYMDGKWYMLCLSGNIYGQLRCSADHVSYNRITFYGVSDKMEGPFYEPENNLLIANMNCSAACAKTVMHNGKRYLFYTEVHENDGEPLEQYNYMSVPKLVTTDKKGGLCLKWYEGIEAYYDGEPISLGCENAVVNDGCWGSLGQWESDGERVIGKCESDWSLQPFAVHANEFVLETSVIREDAYSTGVWFGLGKNVMEGGYAVILDYARKQILITTARNFQIIDARGFEFEKDEYRLKVFVHEKTVEVYLDDTFLLHHLMHCSGGGIALMAESGKAAFEGTILHSMKSFK